MTTEIQAEDDIQSYLASMAGVSMLINKAIHLCTISGLSAKKAQLAMEVIFEALGQEKADLAMYEGKLEGCAFTDWQNHCITKGRIMVAGAYERLELYKGNVLAHLFWSES